jgi:predicted dehydrogenase
MSETLGAAVVGLGVGEQHARAFARDTRSRLRWVYDLDPARMAQVVDALGQGRAAESYEALLGDPEVGLVALATYDHLHGAEVVAALDAGKHVFCEKPLCTSAEELRAIQGALDRRPENQLACNLVLRAAPLYVWLRGAIRAGELGEIYAVDGDYLYGRIHKITDGWRGERADYSVFKGGAVHMVDLLLWLTGERPTTVAAAGNRIATRGTRFQGRDFVAATFQFPSGLVGRITANFGCVHRHHHVLRVFGTKATFLYDDAGARLHETRDPAQVARTVSLAPLPATKGELVPELITRILASAGSSPKIHPDTDHELAVMAACIAADQALESAHPRTIEDLT